MEKEKIVYGNDPDRPGGLVFIKQSRALTLSSIHETVREAKTWREFWSRLPEDEIQKLKYLKADDWPEGDEEFDLSLIPWFYDGDWPGWPNKEMLEWLPEKILKDHGIIDESVLNGEFSTIDAGRENIVVGILNENGYEVIRDDELVSLAIGFPPK